MFLQAQQLSSDILYHNFELKQEYSSIWLWESVINQFKFPTTVISEENNPWMGTLDLQDSQWGMRKS
jgi:predicted transposase YdaD